MLHPSVDPGAVEDSLTPSLSASVVSKNVDGDEPVDAALESAIYTQKPHLHDHLSTLLSTIRLNALIFGCVYTKHFGEVLFAF